MINRKNKSLTSQQQQDLYYTIESYFNIYQANFSSLNHNDSIDIFKNDWCQKNYTQHLLKEDRLLSLTAPEKVIL